MQATRHRRGEVVEIEPFEAEATTLTKTALVASTPGLEVVHVLIAAGERLPIQQSVGGIVLHCLAGRAAIVGETRVHELFSGQLLGVEDEERLAIHALERSSLLLTLPKQPRFDFVEEASEESFPASDPPARVTIVGC